MEAIYIGYLAASVYVCLPFIYWITAPDWWRSQTGRAMMMLLSSTAATLGLIATSSILGAYPGREAVRWVMYSAVLVSGVRIAILFFHLKFGTDWDQRERKSEREPSNR